MRDKSIRYERVSRRGLAATVAFAMLAMLLAVHAERGLAQPPEQKTFTSAEEASQALYLAVRSDNETSMTQILGAGKELVSVDDEVQDRLDRERFAHKYQEMHRLVREPDATTVLYIGAENWPFPIPLVSTNGAWRFDAKAGMEEVLFRRIGENELNAIQASHALVVAEADAVNDGSALPFHGYYFQVHRNQASNAKTRGTSRISDRNKTRARYAVVAYPAEYRRTGVMTYLVSENDVVYEKDLGPNTVQIAKGLTLHNPDSSWHRIELP